LIVFSLLGILLANLLIFYFVIIGKYSLKCVAFSTLKNKRDPFEQLCHMWTHRRRILKCWRLYIIYYILHVPL